MMLNSSITAMKSRPDASKQDISESSVVIGIKQNTKDIKPIIHAIKKTADIIAREIFIFINLPP